MQRLFIKTWLGPVVSRRTPLARVRENYEGIVAKLIAKVEAVPPAKRATRVLIDPLPGLEDSSRYWSVNEVLEHLLIVSRQIERAIIELSAGKVPGGKADTAAVKPRGENRDLLEEFRAYAPEALQRVDKATRAPGSSLESPVLFRHPWFGELTARQWYWLMGSHVGIHYRQAKAIIAGLAFEGSTS